MLNIDEVITAYGQMTDRISDTANARAELSALRESVAALRAENMELRESLHGAECTADDLTAQNAEQARRIDEAANIIATVSLEAAPGLARPIVRRYAIDMCDAWLSATAPAPQDAQS